MAASLATQSLLASPVSARVGNSNRCGVNGLFSSAKYVPHLRRNINVSVRCMAGRIRSQSQWQFDDEPPLNYEMSTKFSDVFAFSGPAPERINWTLAMIGFVAAMIVELAGGQDVFTQISSGGLTWFVGTSVVFSLASLIPLFKGVSVESNQMG